MVKGIRKSGITATLEEAIILRQHIKESIMSAPSTGGLQPQTAQNQEESIAVVTLKGWTLAQAANKTFSLIWRGTADEEGQRIRVRHLEEFFGRDCLLTAITPERVVEFREWAEARHRNSQSTINRKVCALSRILRTAFELGKLTQVPKIHISREKNTRLRFLTPEEEVQTLETFRLLTSTDHVDAFIVLLDTGFRLGELWKVQADNINPVTGTVSLWHGETKNGLARTVPMTSRVREILLRRRIKYPSGPLWPGRNNNWFQYQWGRVRVALGKDSDPDWVTHMLRHTCCSRLVQAGVNLFLVQQWMGHKSLSITQRYAHHAPQHLQDAGAALEQFTAKAQQTVVKGNRRIG